MKRKNVSKQHILDEIKRTASENGGMPLGISKFFQETGIKDTDWAGKHWARWGDALKEAGFEPNQLNAAYEREFLLENFAFLVKELRKFPARRELQMKTRTDEAFPSANTFARFGNKHELAREVYLYCKGKSQFDEIIPICESVLSADSEPNEEPQQEGELGYVYLMKSGRFYKIGRSNAAGRREYELAIQLPDKLTTIHTIKTDDPPGIEAYWHTRFASKRKNGEWFELLSSDVQAFRRRKFM
ncbi:MAG TPA: GIY-YIG nuclease family protein [Terracidiphilus sp.]|nr:GIY-YIG nuclease family protein [Terracidiphilus sp.]